MWKVLKQETPTRVDEINIALQNCIDTIENTKNLLQDKSIKYMNLDKHKEAIELIHVMDKLVEIKSYIESIKCGDTSTPTIAIETPLITTTMPVEEIEPDEEEIDDDEKYLVDPTIPYKLSEDLDFMNTKPCAFELQGTKYAVKDFKGILVKLCELLYRKNQRLFEKIAREHRIKCGENGKVMICFKQDKAASELDKDKCTLILSSDILIFTNTNNPTKVYAIRELLSLYHLSAFSVYLKWDKRITKGQRPIGKLLNIDYDYSQEIVTQQKVKPEIAIGQLAYDFFKEYFKDTQKHYDIKNFLDEMWCMGVLGISCPLFKEFDPNKNIKEQTIWGGKPYPSYAQNPKYRINGKTYLICMKWYEQYRNKLEAWINEQDSTYLERVYSKNKPDDEESIVDDMEETYQEVIEYEQQRLFPNTHQRKAEDCIYFDFKKDQCMCNKTDAPFTMSCSNINSCQYFTTFALHIIPKEYWKNRICPYCGETMKIERIPCTYRPDDVTEKHNELMSYRCEKCSINYISDTFYKGYMQNKNLDDLNVAFIKEDLL